MKATVTLHRLNEWQQNGEPVYSDTGFVFLAPRRDRISRLTIDLKPEVTVLDVDHDSCRLARFEILLPEVEWDDWPDLVVVGFMSELTAAHEVTYRGNYDPRYIPEADRSWKPGIVRIYICPAETEATS